MADSDNPIVTLDNVTKRYGDFVAIDSMNLSVPYGRVFGVLGPNGAGKTTTMRMIIGLLEATEGRIEINGYDIDTQSVEAKSITGFIPDRPYVYDKLTAFEYLRFIAGLYGMPSDRFAKRAPELLEQFKLGGWGDQLVESFSHGMKQRLVFAGALLPDPDLMVIDEPMVGLDPEGHHTVKRLFRTLAHEHNKTILLSTHTLDVAEEVCDEIVLINEGQIIARGTLAELRLEAGSDDGSLEDVFLQLTSEASKTERLHESPDSTDAN